MEAGARRVGLAFVAALLVSASAAAPARGPLVRVATSGDHSELVKTLPITRKSGAEKRVVISLGPDRLPDLEQGDRVRVSAEFQVTGNCGHPDPRCIGPIYHYGPLLRGRLIIAADPNATGGPGTMTLAHPKHEACSQRRPDYEHHCVLVFTKAGFRVTPRLPCPRDDCYVNFVADAHSPRAKDGDVLAVGGLRPDGTIPQDRGRINAIRYRGASPGDFGHRSQTKPLRRRLPPDLRRRVAYSLRLKHLDKGEQLAVTATMRTDISKLRYAVRTSARLILADSPHSTKPSRFVERVASSHGEISENNGSNCTQDEGTCATRKVGVLRIRRDAVKRHGRGVALYVNLVTVLGPKVRKAHADDRVVLRHGGIRVTRFAARLDG
jgi:hypothetical protein